MKMAFTKVEQLLLILCAYSLIGTQANESPRNTISVKCSSTKGDFSVLVHPDWAPIGASRFIALVKDKFFDHMPLYRAVPDFIIQFGEAGDPEVTKKWRTKGTLMDDKPKRKIPFKTGYMSFAGSGPNSRGTAMFFAATHNQNQLDWYGRELWETPFAEIVEGIDVLDRFYRGYGDMAETGGHGPSQHRVSTEGSSYTERDFPLLDYLEGCEIIESAREL